MEFIKTVEVDKGPVVRFIANKLTSLGSWLIDKTNAYAEMYTAVWDDYEEDGDKETKSENLNHKLMVTSLNQMVYLTDDED
jgi:hypothetical protein